MKLNHEKRTGTYKTDKANSGKMLKKSQNDFEAKTMKNRQKGKNITKPIEAKPLTGYLKTPNESKLKAQNYKTNQLQKCYLKKCPFYKTN